jgi:hypothetical protein
MIFIRKLKAESDSVSSTRIITIEQGLNPNWKYVVVVETTSTLKRPPQGDEPINKIETHHFGFNERVEADLCVDRKTADAEGYGYILLP